MTKSSFTALFATTKTILERNFYRLESAISPPKLERYGDGFRYRFNEKNIEQAIIQKLARYLSGLNAAWELHKLGYFQEQAVLQRILDEIDEDITFLSLPNTVGNLSPLHEEYLQWFYQEEFHKVDFCHISRPMIRRDKIRKHIASVLFPENSEDFLIAGEIIYKSYSGFVHAASPHIMDMYRGDPPRFMIASIKNEDDIAQSMSDLWNYFFRGILCVIASASAIGTLDTIEEMKTFRTEFERHSNTDFSIRPKLDRPIRKSRKQTN